MFRIVYFFIIVALFSACTAPYDQELPEYNSELVIEAYVNQANPLLNYVLLSKSVPYYDSSFDIGTVESAEVFVEEGVMENGSINWLRTIEYNSIDSIPGLYFPDLSQLFVGKEGYYYRLSVQTEDEIATAITRIPELVEMDSIWYDNVVNQQTDSLEPYLKFSWNDPPSFGNYYLVADYRNVEENYPLLWGTADRIAVTDDIFFNGDRFEYSEIFPDQYGDTVNMYLISIDQDAYKYWESYEISQGNGGPFSQPINVKSTFDNALGIFQGMAVDAKRIVITKP